MTQAHELDRIVSTEHSDPHTVLGPHVEDGVLRIRVFRPDALEIVVHPEGPGGAPSQAPSQAMRKVHEGGIFEATFPEAKVPFSYRLELRYASGSFMVHDAYAFAPTVGEVDTHLFGEGNHRELYKIMGAHLRTLGGVRGVSFAVWAPMARRVSVVGDFNKWDGRLHMMRRLAHGVWEIFVPELGEGEIYKYEITTMHGVVTLKSDPFGRAMELRPNNASKVARRAYEFTDAEWITARGQTDARRRPMAIYELHLGSWKIHPIEEGEDQAKRWMSYRELAEELVDYVADLGFTHIELLPVMEHPYDGSWGYQVAGFFAPTARYGSPDDFRYFVDRCHARGIGVLLDFTPAHFPKDAFSLGRFDGSALYEHLDPRLGEHKQWGTYVFNYGRPEVRNFLVASALYWLDEFHVDGLRVDAVASMLYLDYGASHPGEWVPNKFGGRENLEAIQFLRELCDAVHEKFPGAVLCAEESTAWPMVTRPTYVGGLGFDFKWNMGWMHDTLAYFELDPIHRTFHHGKITFGLWYAFSECFLLPLSHDEVVHLKRSLISKMPGDRWKMHASLRALYAHMWAHPGKKLLFMGGEIGQYREWNFEAELDWFLLNEPDHMGLQRLMRDLNALYKRYGALHELDDRSEGFLWIDANDATQSAISFVRYPTGGLASSGSDTEKKKLPSHGEHVVCVGSFTPVPRTGYRVGVPRRSAYLEVMNTDAVEYGGSGMGNYGRVEVEDVPAHGFAQSILLTLPPLSVLWLVPELAEDPAPEEEETDEIDAAAD